MYNKKVMVGNSVAKKRTWQRVWYLASSAIVIAVLACSLVLVGMRLVGLQPVTVMSGSMTPNYPVGSLVYVKEVNSAGLKEGEVITFVTDDGTVVTHRIVEVVTETKEDGRTSVKYRTKGDANEVPDGKLVLPDNVLGTPVIIIPQLGYVAYYIQQPPWIYLVLVVGTLLVSSALMPSVMRARQRWAERKKGGATSTTKMKQTEKMGKETPNNLKTKVAKSGKAAKSKAAAKRSVAKKRGVE